MSSATVGSPSRSMRSARVFTKKPVSGSVLVAPAARDRTADHEVALAGEPTEDGRPAGEQRDVGRDAEAPGQRMDAHAALGAEIDVDARAGRVDDQRARAIGRQLEQARRTGEALA